MTSLRSNVIHVRFGPNGARIPPTDRALDLCKRAIELEQSEPYRAMTLCRQALYIDSRCAVAHTILGVVLHSDHRNEEARFHFHEALKLDASSYEATFNLGALAYHDRDLKEARAYFKQALSISPSSKEAVELLDEIESVMSKSKKKSRHVW